MTLSMRHHLRRIVLMCTLAWVHHRGRKLGSHALGVNTRLSFSVESVRDMSKVRSTGATSFAEVVLFSERKRCGSGVASTVQHPDSPVGRIDRIRIKCREPQASKSTL
ncbi:hypothetical protein EDB85DRAFT_1468983 [Lactarius pseudohatsudake]|nr:hypothetical protein EDB85DRAFT_1468983 [Lactarius pseudohatsudake]